MWDHDILSFVFSLNDLVLDDVIISFFTASFVLLHSPG